jgi:pimeloyl-ACP methyl ester carboxylesterase
MKKQILLLPGYDGSGEKTFKKLVPLLSRKYSVETIDYPYFSNPKKQYNLDELVDFVDKKVKDKAIILGFSMGGFVASKYANKYPEKTEKLILVSSSTVPLLDTRLKILLNMASLFFKSRILAFVITKWFLQSNLKDFPLPKPGRNFKAEQGYAVFGSLIKVMREIKMEKIKAKKMAILFEDDNSFPALLCGPKLKKEGFEVKIFKTGGHAEGADYWEKVAKVI